MGRLLLDGARHGDTLVSRLTPSGRIDVHTGAFEDGPLVSTKTASRIIEAFNAGRGHGVLHLGAAELATDLPPSLSYWRDIGAAFVGHVCSALDPTSPEALVIPEPDSDEFATLVHAVPPMAGAETLSIALVRDIWRDMGAALTVEAKRYKDGVQGYLKKHSSVWNVVGRVCLHLAENKHVAATLYGVGARLDHAPELLFTLHGVDATEMVEAVIDQPTVATGKSRKRRVLETDALSSVFGVDIDMNGVSPGGASTSTAFAKQTRHAARRRRSAASTTTTKKTAEPAARKSSAAKRTAAKKKSSAKKITPKKAAAKQVPAKKKTATKRTTATRLARRRAAATTSSAKKSIAEKSASKKSTPETKIAKRATEKKVIEKGASKRTPTLRTATTKDGEVMRWGAQTENDTSGEEDRHGQ